MLNIKLIQKFCGTFFRRRVVVSKGRVEKSVDAQVYKKCKTIQNFVLRIVTKYQKLLNTRVFRSFCNKNHCLNINDKKSTKD